MLSDGTIALFFAAIAFIYASVGFGGGSSYIALLAVAGLPFGEIKLTALLCNIIVVTGGAAIFFQKKQLDLRKTAPLLLASVPMAFLGAKMKIDEKTFFLLLAASLFLAAFFLWFQPKTSNGEHFSTQKPVRDGILGAAIGLFSGMVGIGGGIFLSPILHLFRWGTARTIAAAASVFILANSVSGIAGQLSNLPKDLDWQRIGLLCAAVFIGGQAGSRASQAWFSFVAVRRLTAVLVFAAGVEVLSKHFF